MGLWATDGFSRLDIGTAKRGFWCETCLVPSLLKIPLLLIDGDGVTQLGWADGCMQCDMFRVGASPPP